MDMFDNAKLWFVNIRFVVGCRGLKSGAGLAKRGASQLYFIGDSYFFPRTIKGVRNISYM
jgi:hypothetical protein